MQAKRVIEYVHQGIATYPAICASGDSDVPSYMCIRG